MNSLQTVQKTFQLLQVLAKVAKILCIVGASLCAVAWRSGGQMLRLFDEPLWSFADGADPLQVCAELLAAAIMLTTGAVLLAFAGRYLKAELADGTPFTERGTEQLKKLGIRCICIPVTAIAVAASAAALLGVQGIDIISDLPGVITGVVLILVSLIFCYGAELEGKNGAGGLPAPARPTQAGPVFFAALCYDRAV